MVIIISSTDDGHIPYVTKHLQSDHLVVDVGTVLEGKSFTYQLSRQGLQIYIAGHEIRDVTGVWLRRPRAIGRELETPVKKQYWEYSKSALQECMNQLYAVLQDALWLSDRYALERAENKVYQLICAQEIGFLVPQTLLTSNQRSARAFVSLRQESIVKGLSRSFPRPGNASYLEFFARTITPRDPIRYDGLRLAPAIFQEVIYPQAEYRVTVVGDRVFPAKVLLTGLPKTTIRDWHLGYIKGNLRFKHCTLPKGITDKCVRLVRRLGLHYGAIDLVQDRQGETWFIEINPNGQWAFIEHETKQPIGKAIADLLENRTASR